MSRKKKFAIIFATVLVIYGLIGFVAVPLVLESILPDKISQALDRPVEIQNIRLNPFSLTAAVEGLDIREKTMGQRFVGFDELFVNLQWASLFKLGLVAKEIRLEKPDIRLIRTSETGFNFSDLLPEKDPEAPPEPQPPESDPADENNAGFRFSIANIAITDGRIAFQDQVVDTAHVISAINLNLPLISNFEHHIDAFSEPMLTTSVNQAGLSVDVDTKPFHDTLETIVDLSLSGLSIPYYFAYVPEKKVGFEITDGSLDVNARILFKQMPEKSDLTVQGDIRLTDLQIKDQAAARILMLPQLSMAIAPSRPLEDSLTLASVTFESPELTVVRDTEGVFNLATLGPAPDDKDNENDKADPTKPAKPEATASAADNTAAETSPFILSVNQLDLNNGRILYTDHTVTTDPARFSLDDLSIKISDFTTAPDTRAGVDIQTRINTSAPVTISGQAGITPLFVDGDFSIADLALAWGQPYLPENIHLMLSDGKLAASGHAAVAPAENGGIQTLVTGNAAVTKVDTMDSVKNKKFIAWDTFALDGIEVSVNPLKIHLDTILLKDFENQLIVFNDGTTNLEKIFPTSAAPEDEPASPEAKNAPSEPLPAATADTAPADSVTPFPVSIGEVVLDNFDFQFFDHNIEPNFSTRFNLAELRVTGLTSKNFESADLTAKGKIDEYAPVNIQGKLNPLAETLFLDATFSLSDMELSALSPYTGKFIGRTIQKGKLNTQLSYTIDQKVISAKNHLLLDQFTLGQKVESPDALNLPVGVAIALLKDRKGQINVDLPIAGRTDDPEFGVVKPILKALQNLVVKAATSPFALVGSIVGGGEELRYIEFAAAETTISPDAAKKLDAIGKLMFERPALNLDISGYVDPEADRSALKSLLLTRNIKAASLEKDAPKDPAILDSMTLAPEQYQDLLKQAYAEARLSDAENSASLKPADDPSLNVEEMETRLREQIAISDAALRLLALERAKQVKGHMLEKHDVSGDRLFLTEPETLAPKETKEFKASRVELNVR